MSETETPEKDPALAVSCPDCMAPVDVPCYTRLGDGTIHADRTRNAYLRSVERGTCDLCGKPMVRGTDPVMAWHPDPEDAEVCPPLPDPRRDWNGFALALQEGKSPGQPGLEHFIPQGVTDLPDAPEDPSDPRFAYPGMTKAQAYAAWPCAECGVRRGEHADQRPSAEDKFPALDIADHAFRLPSADNLDDLRAAAERVANAATARDMIRAGEEAFGYAPTSTPAPAAPEPEFAEGCPECGKDSVSPVDEVVGRASDGEYDPMMCTSCGWRE